MEPPTTSEQAGDPGDVLEELAHERDAGAAVAEAEAITIRRALAGLAGQKATAISLVVRGMASATDLEAELEQIAAERSRLEARLAAVDGPGAPELPYVAIDQLEEIRARLYAGLPIEAQQEIVRLLVGRIVIHGETDADGRKSIRAIVDYRFSVALHVDTAPAHRGDNNISPT